MTIAEQIVKKLQDRWDIKFTGKPSIHRTRAGRHQRACGAWSWYLWSDDDHNPHRGNIGSQYPAKQIAKGFTVYDGIGGIDLDPTIHPKA